MYFIVLNVIVSFEMYLIPTFYVQDSEAEVISPLQGYRVMVTNLYSGVTQDDIIVSTRVTL